MDKFLITAHDMPESKTIADSISLTLEAYEICGEAIITTWDDVVGTIKMNKFLIPATGVANEAEFKEMIISLLNDGGFGAKDIKGAFVEVYAKYSGVSTANVYATEFFVEKPGFKLTEKEKEFAYNAYLYN